MSLHFRVAVGGEGLKRSLYRTAVSCPQSITKVRDEVHKDEADKYAGAHNGLRSWGKEAEGPGVQGCSRSSWATQNFVTNMENKQLKGYRVRLTACFMAGIVPAPIMEGSTPACDQETFLAKGLSLRLSASVFFIRTTAAAPSFIPVNK